MLGGLRRIGRRVVDGVWRMGVATRFFVLTLSHSGRVSAASI
jgi:phospholipid/cholesterol/gamma-HCH transport system permease protein